jgi:nucleoredoxin
MGLSHLIRAGPAGQSRTPLAIGPATNLEGKVVALYFSAHWCPPCRAFTPALRRTYEAVVNGSNGSPPREFELIFISGDRSPAEYESYLREMPNWLATPFQSPAAGALREHYGVRGIPSLVFLTADGGEITRDGRQLVSQVHVYAVHTHAHCTLLSCS